MSWVPERKYVLYIRQSELNIWRGTFFSAVQSWYKVFSVLCLRYIYMHAVTFMWPVTNTWLCIEVVMNL